ncbi:glucosamine-6-phosphate deaminase [Lichtheimia ornata]|uniref:Glucosamine-6-phosphate isomerase n=1 Tax=Lichtheimia ornata TaxID=688661 RepID=A0AAD7XZF2_9FUNG|nr:glucosamine-6-phosphate deaminase [Lichtheimia ornata]KAJ8660080.1 glucosamine-6-phosphate deaminase [Lichtheimia ornata]
MRLVVRQDYEEVSSWIAHYIKERIKQFQPTKERPFVLGLPTGSSPIGCYRRLADFCKTGELSFKNVVTFNMDEYVGIPRDHPESYYSFMWTHLFQHIDILPENIHVLDGNAADLDEECRRYEASILAHGGIELFLGGIGPDGHIAFNEPGSSLTSRTRVKTLAYETIIANARFFDGDITKVPKLALTVGVATIMDAREVCIIITGAHKSIALAKCVEEGVNHMWTVSAIQMHPKGLIVCDEDATLELHVKTVKYFKSIEHVHQSLIGKENLGLQGELLSNAGQHSAGAVVRGREQVKQLLSDEESDTNDVRSDDGQSADSVASPTKRRRTTADSLLPPASSLTSESISSSTTKP